MMTIVVNHETPMTCLPLGTGHQSGKHEVFKGQTCARLSLVSHPLGIHSLTYLSSISPLVVPLLENRQVRLPRLFNSLHSFIQTFPIHSTFERLPSFFYTRKTTMDFSQDWRWGSWLTKKKLLLSCIGALILLALGLNIEAEQPVSRVYKRILKRCEDVQASKTDVIWQPQAGIKWQIQLENPVDDISMDADVFDIDLFDNTNATISKIHAKGAKVICYFSAGTYEDWRSDANKFVDSDFGNEMEDWPGERWLDVHSANVRQIMTSRLDMAQKKGCDGVDPDNIDAYGNDNGLSLTEADSINYLNFLSSEAHSRGMSVGLKNGGDIIPSVIERCNGP